MNLRETAPIRDTAPNAARLPVLHRAARYGVVGMSGVLVNLSVLWFASNWLFPATPNLSSAVAIEISIVWSFCLHDRWTFEDRKRATTPLLKRLLRFHAVALVGATLQWSTFAGLNFLYACHAFGDAMRQVCTDSLGQQLQHAVFSAPEVGNMKFVSQSTGIALSTLWNFILNVRWTFRVERPPRTPD